MRWLLIILVVLGVAAALTNPTEDDLRGVLTQFVSAKVDEKVEQTVPQIPNLPGPLADIRERAKDTIKANVLSSIGIRRSNYFLFSVFHLDIPNVPTDKPPPQCVIGAFKAMFVPLDKC
jgi:hypothetical protein